MLSDRPEWTPLLAIHWLNAGQNTHTLIHTPIERVEAEEEVKQLDYGHEMCVCVSVCSVEQV